MILLVATNPSIDRTVYVPQLHPHGVHRANQLHLTAGGKAINVARAAHQLGAECLIVGFLAGHAGKQLEEMVAAENLSANWLYLAEGQTKMTMLCRHDEGDCTVINEPGPFMQPSEWQSFADRVITLAKQADAVVLAGSIPPGVHPAEYVELCHSLTKYCNFVYVDTPDDTLKGIIANPRNLHIKVNITELAHAMKSDLGSRGSLQAAMRSLIGAGAKMAGVTLGAQGAVIATADKMLATKGISTTFVSSVGCGDSFTAGLVWAKVCGRGELEQLRLAVGCGAANAETLFPACFTAGRALELQEQVSVELW